MLYITCSTLCLFILSSSTSGYLRLGAMARDKGNFYEASDWFKEALQINQVLIPHGSLEVPVLHLTVLHLTGLHLTVFLCVYLTVLHLTVLHLTVFLCVHLTVLYLTVLHLCLCVFTWLVFT